MPYLVLDGPDGSGKSSQAGSLALHLRAAGREVVHLREPGSTPVGEALRRLLLAPSTGALLPVTEALLFSAARAELVQTVIAPALARGALLVAERCYVSTLVYQCLAADSGSDYEQLLAITRRVHGGCMPDAVFVLDVPPATGRQRRASRVDDRFEQRGEQFEARVRAAYLEVARREPNVQIVDADRPFAEVQADLRARCARWLR
jgi:dTMP kinase